jgi:hypothetical protein
MIMESKLRYQIYAFPGGYRRQSNSFILAVIIGWIFSWSNVEGRVIDEVTGKHWVF